MGLAAPAQDLLQRHVHERKRARGAAADAVRPPRILVLTPGHTACGLMAASRAAFHDAVIGTACPRAARAGTVPEQHLRGRPAVQLHQVALCTAPVQPGMTDMVTEPMRIHRDAALAAAPDHHLVDPVGRHRRPVHSEPEFRPVRLGVPRSDPEVAVDAAGGLMADPDDPRLAALAADGDLPLPQPASLRGWLPVS